MSTRPDPAALRVARAAQARYRLEAAPIGRRGDVGLADGPTARAVAAQMNAVRAPGAASVQAGDVAALSLLHEIAHLLVERFEETDVPRARQRAVEGLRASLGRDGDRVLDRFAKNFPARLAEPEDAASIVGELILTRLANENPALGPLRELVDDAPLARSAKYSRAVGELEALLIAAGPVGGAGDGGRAADNLLDLLRAPARHAPTSLAGQLRYIRENWPALLGDNLGGLLDRLDVALGVLAEEERGLHLRFGGGGAGGKRRDGPEFVGLDAEVERFSTDSDWMPRLVLMAKATYVWLDQLSRRYGRDIRTLDAIPDEALDEFRGWGVTGLWLIGLWQRSQASETIKRMRGNPDAVASAYSLDDYRIADDIGGEAAFENLRDRAWARGIRLASDMVPNHMGIDSRWVIEHPEWFLSVPEPPYPAYTFNGPDLSPDGRVSIVLEDHYWDATDAAVVFKHRDHATGASRYIYHGNDGTSFPWNDTAQLDFIQAEVREQVIQTILAVARRFPVIRFDAAMVLARKHVQRLWWPLPGAGDGIPSRAEHAMRKAAFDKLMPTEFWREVVDRVAAEVPDTLLLAEAFWLLEGYFVRTLGMHRVYNSAFMHMLRDEDNAGYRKVIRDTLEFDPDILKRYVNFMSNPDEETAIEQFGSGDKYLGVATLLVTLPGLPMLGHGQVEGFTEKYGMEFRRPRLDERPDDGLVARHEERLFPLVHRRAMFADARDFLLYDLVRDDGSVDENVYAYSNGTGEARSLIVFHNRFGDTTGTIRESVPFAVKGPEGSKTLIRRSLADGLGISPDPDLLIGFRDERADLEYLLPAARLREGGLRLTLDAYRCHVLTGFRELRDTPAQPWSHLATQIGDRGVPSLDDALRDLALAPVHDALRAAVADPGRLPGLLAAVGAAHPLSRADEPGAEPRSGTGSMELDRALHRRDRIARLAPDPRSTAVLGAWSILDPVLSAFGPTVFTELRLGGPLDRALADRHHLDADAARDVGWDGAVLVAAAVAPNGDRARLAAWVADPTIRVALHVHGWDGVEWLDGQALDALVARVALAQIVDGTAPRTARARATRLRRAVERAGYRVDALVAPAPRPRPRG
ncbi:MAG: alpha-amylase family glycosyl hydrolase [Chloroflexota bacterium]